MQVGDRLPDVLAIAQDQPRKEVVVNARLPILGTRLAAQRRGADRQAMFIEAGVAEAHAVPAVRQHGIAIGRPCQLAEVKVPGADVPSISASISGYIFSELVRNRS